jgi:hypothetical protein
MSVECHWKGLMAFTYLYCELDLAVHYINGTELFLILNVCRVPLEWSDSSLIPVL